MSDGYIILSLKHTSNKSLHIIMWAPDSRGYAWVIPSAGVYGEAEAQRLNDGRDCIAVPVAVVHSLAVPQPAANEEGRRFYDTPGDCLKNDRETWIKLMASSMVKGRHIGVTPYPNWRGRSPAYRDRRRMCWSCYTVYDLKGNAKACPSCDTPPRKRGER